MLHNKNVMLSSILTFGYKKAPDAESTEGYVYSLSSVVSFFGNIGGILLSTKTTARLITVVTPIAIAALS